MAYKLLQQIKTTLEPIKSTLIDTVCHRQELNTWWSKESGIWFANQVQLLVTVRMQSNSGKAVCASDCIVLMRTALIREVMQSPPIICLSALPSACFHSIFGSDWPLTLPVSVAQWANALSEPQHAARPDWLETCNGLGSIPGRGLGFSVSWTNKGHCWPWTIACEQVMMHDHNSRGLKVKVTGKGQGSGSA